MKDDKRKIASVGPGFGGTFLPSGWTTRTYTAVGICGLAPELSRNYGNSYPVETAHLRFGSGLAGEVPAPCLKQNRVRGENLTSEQEITKRFPACLFARGAYNEK